MSVEYVTGNALDFPNGSNVLLHGCNTLGIMGAGIAKQIAEEYPAALEADAEALKEGNNELGMMSMAEVAGGKRIVNGYIQSSIGTDSRKVDYEALYEALYVVLSRLHTLLKNAHGEGRVYTLCMPWIGCGLAGGSRKVVGAMIEDVFGESPVKVYVVEYAKKSVAMVLEADTNSQ